MNLRPIEFGTRLIETGDLDPVYVMLEHSALPFDQKTRFCIAYWLYYHSGVSAAASELNGIRFWNYLELGLNTFPRGTERRHFRGEKARVAVLDLRRRYPTPEEMAGFCAYGLSSVIREGTPGVRGGGDSGSPFNEVSRYVQEHQLFGPWIAFKIADMLERVLYVPIDFKECDLLKLYSEPRTGAKWASSFLGFRTGQETLDYLIKIFGAKYAAPPSGTRRINIQEAETVLCKWKSHMNGHYYIGKDIVEVEHALLNPDFRCKAGEKLCLALRANTKFKRASLV